MESKVKQNILSISIAIILALFIGYGIQTFYPTPKYEDFCNETFMPKAPIATENECLTVGGKWSTYPIMVGDKTQLSGSCDSEFTCRQNFNDTLTPYNRNVFIITVILGILFIILGGAYIKNDSVSFGVMGGAVLTIVYGTMRYWNDMSSIIKWVLLGVSLAVLIWLGYTRMKK